jgi:2-keto-myo-inositol isomerase
MVEAQIAATFEQWHPIEIRPYSIPNKPFDPAPASDNSMVTRLAHPCMAISAGVLSMSDQVSRREMLLRAGCALGAGAAATISPMAPNSALAAAPSGANTASSAEPFGYCLNMSTIMGQKLSIVEEVQIAAKAGYQAIEPWIRELDQFVKDGGSLKDLGKRIADAGLTVESAIGFAQWIVDDDDARAKGLEEAKRNMDMLVQIGGKRLAAPPVGATKQTDLNLFKAGQRYRALLDIGQQMGIVPEVEVWGHSTSLQHLSEAVFVAVESGHPQACLLPDIYHLYRGGSDFAGLKLLSGAAVQVFHVNDYPATPARAELTDAARVYPGDGVAPFKTIFRDLRDSGFRGMLSLELFNRDYWQQDPLQVAKTGLEKTRAVVQASLA